MTDLFAQSEIEKQLQDFDSVWPGSESPSAIIDAWRDAARNVYRCEPLKITHIAGDKYTVHSPMVGDFEITAQQIKESTQRLTLVAGDSNDD